MARNILVVEDDNNISNLIKMYLDKEGFDKAMDEQRERARSARAENQRVAVPDLSGIDVSKLKVDPEAKEAKVVAIWKDGKLVDEITDGEEAGIILDKTPFYAEGGGQVGIDAFALEALLDAKDPHACGLPAHQGLGGALQCWQEM